VAHELSRLQFLQPLLSCSLANPIARPCDIHSSVDDEIRVMLAVLGDARLPCRFMLTAASRSVAERLEDRETLPGREAFFSKVRLIPLNGAIIF